MEATGTSQTIRNRIEILSFCTRACECAGVGARVCVHIGQEEGGGTSPNENYVSESHGTSSNAKSRRRHAKQCNSDHMTFSLSFQIIIIRREKKDTTTFFCSFHWMQLTRGAELGLPRQRRVA